MHHRAGLAVASIGLVIIMVYSVEATPTLSITSTACIKNAQGETTTVDPADCFDKVRVTGGTSGTPPLPASFKIGKHEIVWTATGSSGQTVSTTQTLIVQDLQAPTMSILTILGTGDKVINAREALTPIPIVKVGGRCLYQGVCLHDNVTPLSDLSLTVTPKRLALGKHKIVWNATDEAGLWTAATQNVVVKDTTKPSVECAPDVVIMSKVPVSKSSFTLHPPTNVHDSVDGSIMTSPTNNVDEVITNGKFPVGTTTVTWSVGDSSGNIGTCKQEVLVSSLRTSQTFPPSGIAGVGFGRSLVSSGNYLFVGDPYDNTSATNSGSVRQYPIKPNEVVASLTYYGTSKNQYFGNALAVMGSGGGSKLVVGAKGHGSNEGAVLIYEPANASTLKLTRTITNPGTVSYVDSEGNAVTSTTKAQFGASLAIMWDKIVVGAPRHEEGGKLAVGKVYVFNSKGTKLYEISNPAPTAFSQFGINVEASSAGHKDIIYVSARTGGTNKGVVYRYDVTETTGTSSVPSHTTIPSGSSTLTKFGETQVRVGNSGGAYVGEPLALSATAGSGKIHRYSAAGSLINSIDAPTCCNAEFGSAFDIGQRFLYAGDRWVASSGALTAFDLTAGDYRGAFANDAPQISGYATTHYGFSVEMLRNNKLAVSEYLENPNTGGDLTRVHILDAGGLEPPITSVQPQIDWEAILNPILNPVLLTSVSYIDIHGTASVPDPVNPLGASGASGASPAPQLPIQTRTVPTLSSTTYVSPDKIKLTYDMSLDPFVVDMSDYIMIDAGLEVVRANVDGAVVTLTYVGSPRSGTASDAPNVEMIGDIGYY